MKNILCIVIILCASVLLGFSQENQYKKHTVSVGVGPSLLGKVIDVVASELEDSTTLSSSQIFPVCNLSYDFCISDWFSIGGSVTLQYMGFHFDNYSYDDNATTRYADASVALHRMNFAVRPLFYYTNTDKLHVYSGFRLGYLSNKLIINTDAEGLDKEDFSFKIGTRPSFQLIICGIRYQITDIVGIHSELAVGSPYYFNAGVQFHL
ncbi:MAG: hypothetical protein PF481_04310 [Bacteroidales bacterium]|jgi:hypothetical protein|nr:hypothetical protein [Bacteroidales bacterium]